jgi:hypothetical protein
MTESFGPGGDDFWLIKTDAAGKMQWNQTYGGPNGDYGFSLVATSDGGYAVAGSTYSFGAGKFDSWLVKTDAAGNMEWNRTYGGAGSDIAASLGETLDGGYALAGYTYLIGAGNSDLWLVKTDEQGVIPEFPAWIILPLLLSATLTAIITCRKFAHPISQVMLRLFN